MSSKLSPHQIAQSVYDIDNNSIRASLQNLEIAIELNAADGDSVTALPQRINSYATFSTAQTLGSIAIAAADISSCSAISLAVKNQGSTVSLLLEVSPSDTADVWLTLATHTATTGTTHVSPSLFPVRRVRVSFGGNFAGDGQIQLWVNGR